MSTSSTPGTRAAGGIVAAYETEPDNYNSFKAAMAATEKGSDGLVWPDAPSEEEFEVLQKRLRRKVSINTRNTHGWPEKKKRPSSDTTLTPMRTDGYPYSAHVVHPIGHKLSRPQRSLVSILSRFFVQTLFG
jgi:hypothetical protein